MSGPYTITPEALYDDFALCKSLGLRVGSLEKARKVGELRFTRKGGRVLYLGQWVHDWLTRDAAPEREATACA